MRKIDRMHFLFGKADSGECKDCPHFLRHQPTDRHFYKCRAYGLSRSEATDWRVHYPACKLIESADLGPYFVPVIERMKHESRKIPERPIEWQIKMEVAENDEP